MLEATKQKTEGESPLCWVKSGADGVFVFPSTPSGDYTLVSSEMIIVLVYTYCQ